MNQHEFDLILSDVDDLTPDVMDALFLAGCADATPCRAGGRTYLAFDREGSTRFEAIESAIRDVKRAGFRAELGVAVALQAARYKFALALIGAEDRVAGLRKALREVGCDDATPCHLDGQTYVIFVREAPSRGEAIASAMRDVTRAGFEAARPS